MAHDPVTGPLSRQEFAELVTVPYGEATKRIRKHDPFYQNGKGKFRVKASGRMTGTAYVEASSQEEADKLADDLTDADFDWQDNGSGWDIIAVELDKR